MRNVYLVTVFSLVLLVSVLGLRGTKFTHPPMDVFPEWLFPGMKEGRKMHPQEGSAFFADGRADRLPPPNVVAASYGPAGQPLRNDAHLYTGKLADGSFARGFPAALTVDMKFLERGRERFTIYCLPCHGAVGDGNGVTKRYGMGATPDLPRRPSAEDGRGRNLQHDHQRQGQHEPLRGQARPRGPLGRDRLRARPPARPAGHRGGRSRG